MVTPKKGPQNGRNNLVFNDIIKILMSTVYIIYIIYVCMYMYIHTIYSVHGQIQYRKNKVRTQGQLLDLNLNKKQNMYDSHSVRSKKQLSNLGVSKNLGKPPKSSILIGFSIIHHPFWGTPIFGNTHFKKHLNI